MPPAIRLIVPLGDAGLEIEECIESILQQKGTWKALFIGRAEDRPRVPAGDARIAFREGDSAEPAAADDVVIVLDPTHRFRDDGALQRAAAGIVDHVYTRIELPPIVHQTSVAAGGPMISCLMVTRDRVSLARRAIRSYADQTWLERELVIVTDGTEWYRQSLLRYAASIGAPNVRFIDPGPRGQTLGALRNRSLDEARGEWICQWDDDDCSHPLRLELQATHMRAEGARASFLTEHLQLMTDDATLCWIDWTLGHGRGKDFAAPGTLMMARDSRFRYPAAGPRARRGEDSVLLERLHEMLPVTYLTGAGHLFLYQYHGRNTFSRAHHRALGDYRRTGIAHLHAHETELRAAAAYYRISAPVVVIGREGPAFTLSAL